VATRKTKGGSYFSQLSSAGGNSKEEKKGTHHKRTRRERKGSETKGHNTVAERGYSVNPSSPKNGGGKTGVTQRRDAAVAPEEHEEGKKKEVREKRANGFQGWGKTQTELKKIHG